MEGLDKDGARELPTLNALKIVLLLRSLDLDSSVVLLAIARATSEPP